VNLPSPSSTTAARGICGSCGFLINGVAHGGRRGTTVCQLSMRFFKDGDSLTLEPWRSAAFPIVRDLIVNRSAVRPDHPGWRVHLRAYGERPAADAILVAKEDADTAFDAAACIGCGACVAACRTRPAMLFTSASSPTSTRFRRVSRSATRGR